MKLYDKLNLPPTFNLRSEYMRPKQLEQYTGASSNDGYVNVGRCTGIGGHPERKQMYFTISEYSTDTRSYKPEVEEVRPEAAPGSIESQNPKDYHLKIISSNNQLNEMIIDLVIIPKKKYDKGMSHPVLQV